MARIKCKYFNKGFSPSNDLGNLNLSFSKFAHAMLSLHSGLGSKPKRAIKVMNYFLQLIFDFRKQRGDLVMNNISNETYDGIKKISDLYGAAITVAAVQKIYNYPHVIPLQKDMVISVDGKRPDFVAVNNGDYSLFESKA